MPKIIFLGTAYAVADHHHGNTHLAIVTGDRTVIIDSSGDPTVRLEQAGIQPTLATDLILTHFHPDHVGGVPLLLMDMWLMGRKLPLEVYGLAHTLDRIETVMQLYDWHTWPNFFPVHFHRLREEENAGVMVSQEVCITASPLKHFIPSIGLRLEFPQAGKVVTYTADTAPCPQLTRLAMGSDILIHEASGASEGHSSARQAGETARAAEARALYLIHYPGGASAPEQLTAEARQAFDGPVRVVEDFQVEELG